MAAIEQDDERRARDRLLEEAEIDAVAAHLGHEPVKLAREPDRGAHIAAQLGLAILGKITLQAIESGR